MKLNLYLIALLSICLPLQMQAEGSVDFIEYEGYRLMMRTDKDQQMKVYAAAGEFINFGSSHLNIQGGYIDIYQPDGTLYGTYDGTNGDEGIIYDNVQELNGPTGGSGYMPIVVPVTADTEGIWSLVFKYPSAGFAPWTNILNSAPWTRENDQPTTRRSILAWDVTVSQNAAGNDGGTLLTGRVYTNEYNSMISENGYTTSPSFYVQTWDGFLYRVDFNETDPFGFPIFSNLLGITNEEGNATYQSSTESLVTRTVDMSAPGLTIYEPQAQDEGLFINNKLFFNIPNEDLPEEAITTDIFRDNTHTTWLIAPVPDLAVAVEDVVFSSSSQSGDPCLESVLEVGSEALLVFTSPVSQTIEFGLDLNNNGVFGEPYDYSVIQFVEAGTDTIVWDGNDNSGNPVIAQQIYNLTYSVRLRGGETHILMQDVENNVGGVTFELISDVGASDTDVFFYDHSPIGGEVSGGGTPGNPLPTNMPFTYEENFGNGKILDYWVSIVYEGENTSMLTFVSNDDCQNLTLFDSDNDGITDDVDIDDDNDGVPDLMEMCQGQGFDCLPDAIDPSGDLDEDGIPNYVDPDVTGCTDTVNGGFMCRIVPAEYDTDGDNIPDHLDLDSDNDGITDLYEASHGFNDQDTNGDGRLDGEAADFGDNGFYNALATDDNDLGAVANYEPSDKDMDGIMDLDDLDSDNDGIYDVLEAGLNRPDEDNDGRLGSGMLAVYPNGIVEFLAFERTGMPVPNPHDTDGDAVPDFRDLDSDNDLIIDVVEGGQEDSDLDAMLGSSPLTVDANGVALNDVSGAMFFATSAPSDTDGDLYHDFRDLDADNDLIYDVFESGVGNEEVDPDLDGIAGVGVPVTDDAKNGLVVADSEGTAFTFTAYPIDNDGDGIATFRDLDSDNDGLNDVLESVTVNIDPDNDGLAGVFPVQVNGFGVAVADAAGTVFPAIQLPFDKDQDTVRDWLDLDSDNDLITDCAEARNQDPDADGRVGTGVPPVNTKGQVLNPDGTLVSTSGNTDKDMDLVPDFRDLDSDNDGINDVKEGTILDGTDPDNDGIAGVGTPEVDSDGLPVADSEGTAQTPITVPYDTDNDTWPDFLDLDTDNDGINDVEEAGFDDPDNNGFVGTGIPTVDADGQAAQSTSSPQDFDGDTYPDFRDLDADNDAINDVEEAGFEDPDNDGHVGTGIPEVNDFGQAEGANSDPRDTDEDGTPDYHDLDSDGDGLVDTYEAGFEDPDNDGLPGQGIPAVNTMGQPDGANSTPPDLDGDGLANYIDLDSDADDISDMDECPTGFNCDDSDGDGEVDPYDVSCYHPLGTVSITEVTGAGTICEGESIDLSGFSSSDGPFTYTWSGPGGFSFTDNSQAGESMDLTLNNISPAQAGTYSLFGVTLDGCETDPLSVLVQVNPRPETPTLTSDADFACSGEDAVLMATPVDGLGVMYVWEKDGVVVAETESTLLEIADLSPENTGTYTVLAIANDCPSNYSLPVELAVTDNPDAVNDTRLLSFDEGSISIDVLENDVIAENAEVTLNMLTAPQLGELIETAPGVFEYQANPGAFGVDVMEYELCNAYCPDDCDRAELRIEISSRDEKGNCFYLNVITPNNDNKNDALVFPCLEDEYRDNNVKIFNRWGDKLLDEDNYRNDWTGTYRGRELPAGTYFYIIDLGEDVEPVQGYFSLMR